MTVTGVRDDSSRGVIGPISALNLSALASLLLRMLWNERNNSADQENPGSGNEIMEKVLKNIN